MHKKRCTTFLGHFVAPLVPPSSLKYVEEVGEQVFNLKIS